VRYHYRSLPFHRLVGMYGAADVSLVTPLRDGMNLIAKEYVAARGDNGGVLVLSEMAGAAKELGEAVLVNPFDRHCMVEAILTALEMPEEEQRDRIEAMQHRLKRYTVRRWAEDFLQRLEEIKLVQMGLDAHMLDEWATERLVSEYSDAEKRLLVLDYDGTLMRRTAAAEPSSPDPDLLDLLERLCSDERNEVVVVSGRDRSTLDQWLGHLCLDLVAEHGVWLKSDGGDWVTIEPLDAGWKELVLPIMEIHDDRTPGAYLEEKDFSLVWHYGSVHPELGATRAEELREALDAVAADLGVAVIDGNKLIEVTAAGVSKGRAAYQWMGREDHAFILVGGDDKTDDEVFEAAPDDSWTIRVGYGPTLASHSVRSVTDLRNLLERMLEK
jgi:trehalose 6-phosphate synthase/phosphatase